MRKLRILIALLVMFCLAGCDEAVDSGRAEPSAATEPSTQTLQTENETTAPTETTESQPAEIKPTQPPRIWVPQDPDPIDYPDGEIQATLVFFAGNLYVHDNREGTTVDTLPEGYFYVARIAKDDPSTVPGKRTDGCHVPDLTALYACPQEPDYIYYNLEAVNATGYRRMIRGALVENYWDAEEIPGELPEDYVLQFFRQMLNNYSAYLYNPYGMATELEFSHPRDIDLNRLFYNGFPELAQHKIPLTEEERAFLLANGFTESSPGYWLHAAERLPVDHMDRILRQYFDIGFWDTDRVGVDTWLAYWQQNQCYYIWRTGARFHTGLTVMSVKIDGDTIEIVYSDTDGAPKPYYLMTLERVGDILKIRSNVKVE